MYVSIFLFHLSIWFFFLISEIGVALTTFGGLFMLLGVMLFFDGALLALGNVGNFLPLPISFDKEAHIYPLPPPLPPSPSLSLSLSQKELEETTDCHTHTCIPIITTMLILVSFSTDPLHLGFNIDHRTSQDILLFREKTKDSRDPMLFRRCSPRLSQVAVHWDDGRDLWIFESLWVRFSVSHFLRQRHGFFFFCGYSDFFPVVITFLRQLPFIGTILSLPYIHVVSPLSLSLSSCFTYSYHVLSYSS